MVLDTGILWGQSNSFVQSSIVEVGSPYAFTLRVCHAVQSYVRTFEEIALEVMNNELRLF